MSTKWAVNGAFIGALSILGALTARSMLMAVAIAAIFLAAVLLPTWFGGGQSPAQTKATDQVLARCINLTPLALGLGSVNQKLSLLALVGMAAVLLPRIHLGEKFGIGWHAAVVFGAIAQAVLMYRLDAPVQTTAAVVVALMLVTLWQSKLDRMWALEALMDSIAIYLVVSLVAYYGLGLRSAAQANRLGGYSSTVGFFHLRIFFPFATSMIVAPALASAYLCWAIPRTVARHLPRKPLNLVGIAAAVFALLAADYRVPIVVFVGCLLVGWLRPRFVRAAAIPLAIIVLLLPFWWNDGRNPVRAVVDTVTQQAGGALQREGEGSESGTLGNRTHLWRWARDSYERAPLTKQLLGFGYNGQVKSGASQEFFWTVEGFASSGNVTSAHSSAWQMLLDGGALGLLLLIGMVVVGLLAARQACASGHRSEVLLSATLPLLALVATSGTEMTLAAGTGAEVFWLFVLLAGVAVCPNRMTATVPAQSGALVSSPS